MDEFAGNLLETNLRHSTRFSLIAFHLHTTAFKSKHRFRGLMQNNRQLIFSTRPFFFFTFSHMFLAPSQCVLHSHVERIVAREHTIFVHTCLWFVCWNMLWILIFYMHSSQFECAHAYKSCVCVQCRPCGQLSSALRVGRSTSIDVFMLLHKFAYETESFVRCFFTAAASLYMFPSQLSFNVYTLFWPMNLVRIFIVFESRAMFAFALTEFAFFDRSIRANQFVFVLARARFNHHHVSSTSTSIYAHTHTHSDVDCSSSYTYTELHPIRYEFQ